MTDKELFYQRIEEEYKDYVTDLDDYEAAEMMDEAEFTGNFKEIYEYLMRDKPIDGEQLAHFMKIKQPLHFICKTYQEDKPPIYDTLNHTIWRIENEGLLDYAVNEESGKLVEMMREEYDNNDLHYGGKEHPFAADSLAKAIISEDFCFPEEDAKMLLQFKKPFSVLLDLYTDSRLSTFEDQYPAIMDKLRSMDLLPGTYALKKDAILPETKYRHDFINRVVELVPEPNYETTAKWIDFAKAIHDSDDFDFTKNPYEEFGQTLQAVLYRYGDKIVQTIYDLADKNVFMPGNELLGAADYLYKGGEAEKIGEMEKNDAFVGFEPDEQQGGMELC